MSVFLPFTDKCKPLMLLERQEAGEHMREHTHSRVWNLGPADRQLGQAGSLWSLLPSCPCVPMCRSAHPRELV
jgi:hypothetical protein